MKHYFQQEKSGQTDAVGLAWQVASALVIVSLCYTTIPAFAGACNRMAAACSFMPDVAGTQAQAHIAAAPVSLAMATTHAVTPYGGGGEISAPKFDSATGAVFPAKISPTQTGQNGNAALPTVPPSMLDRHWCIAEAFKASLDHEIQESPIKAASSNAVTQPVYTGYCQVPGSETSVKMGVPLHLLRQCRAVRT